MYSIVKKGSLDVPAKTHDKQAAAEFAQQNIQTSAIHSNKRELTVLTLQLQKQKYASTGVFEKMFSCQLHRETNAIHVYIACMWMSKVYWI